MTKIEKQNTLIQENNMSDLSKQFSPEWLLSSRKASAPCDSTCSKCGGADIHRLYKKPGDSIKIENGGKERPFLKRSPHSPWWDVIEEHIIHHCRVCHFEWSTPVLNKNL